MTGASSSSSPSRLPPLASVVSPENGEESAAVVDLSPPATDSDERGLAWRRLSGVETGPIRGIGCTSVWGDIVIVWHGRTWRRLSGVLTGPIRGVGCTGVWGDYVKYRGMK
ncbi:hypothetical protein L3X38_026817 [Prunus dulcis]|uniref:Uncharacterized protein n=1 Tax=Prunus dulcis TaxID=3755 RepID=A0AAD4VP22_PRUDU|nr:hypothetical protein L3X38_026817 [Prunus dulcis]